MKKIIIIVVFLFALNASAQIIIGGNTNQQIQVFSFNETTGELTLQIENGGTEVVDLGDISSLSELTVSGTLNIPRQATPPTVDVLAGSIYIDSDDGLLYIYDGTTWNALSGGSGGSGGLLSTDIDLSSELAAILTDETGTGLVVFNDSPTLITPDLGTPSNVDLANATTSNLTPTGQEVVSADFVDAKLSDVFEGILRPEDFGAFGDGVTDDTAAFNSMVAAIPTANESVNFFGNPYYKIELAPSKIYSLSNGLDLTGKINVLVEGNKSLIRYTGTGKAINLTQCQNVDISNIQVLLEQDLAGVVGVYRHKTRYCDAANINILAPFYLSGFQQNTIGFFDEAAIGDSGDVLYNSTTNSLLRRLGFGVVQITPDGESNFSRVNNNDYVNTTIFCQTGIKMQAVSGTIFSGLGLESATTPLELTTNDQGLPVKNNKFQFNWYENPASTGNILDQYTHDNVFDMYRDESSFEIPFAEQNLILISGRPSYKSSLRNYILNGTFDSEFLWDFGNASVVNNKAEVTVNAGAFSFISYPVNLIVGFDYILKFTVNGGAGNSIRVQDNAANTGALLANETETLLTGVDQELEYTFTATENSRQIIIARASATTYNFTIDNVSLHEAEFLTEETPLDGTEVVSLIDAELGQTSWKTPSSGVSVNSIGSAEIINNSIEPEDLKYDLAPTDGQFLTVDPTNGEFVAVNPDEIYLRKDSGNNHDMGYISFEGPSPSGFEFLSSDPTQEVRFRFEARDENIIPFDGMSIILEPISATPTGDVNLEVHGDVFSRGERLARISEIGGGAGAGTADATTTTVQNGVTEANVQLELEKLNESVINNAPLIETANRVLDESDVFRNLTNSTSSNLEFVIPLGLGSDGDFIAFTNLSTGNIRVIPSSSGITFLNYRETLSQIGASIVIRRLSENVWYFDYDKGVEFVFTAPSLNILYEGQGALTNNVQPTSSINVAYPTYVAGEVWVAQVYVKDLVTYNIPTGWNLIGQTPAGTGSEATALAIYRIPDGTETGLNLTITSDGTLSEVVGGVIHRYSGVNVSNPIEQIFVGNQESTAAIIPPSVTSSFDGGLHVDLIYFDENQGTNDTPGDTTENYTYNSNLGGDISFSTYSEYLNSGVSSGGDVSYTFNTSGHGGGYITFILNAQ